MVQSPDVRRGDVVLLVGTRKGGIILSSDASRKNWSVSDLHCAGGNVFHMTYDPRGDGKVLAAVNYEVWGPEVHVSNDMGNTWSRSGEHPRFDEENERKIEKIWHIKPAGEDSPGVLYAGVDPGSLFKSEDDGASWNEVVGLSNHPTRDLWQPGGGGLCLHTIVLDPLNKDRMWVGISAVGVFGTADGGESWQPMNKGVRADFLPERFPDFGQCPHKVLAHPSKPNVLFQQNHCGVFRSNSAGESWDDITEGLPSRFGFVLGLHSQDPDTLYVMPEDKVMADGEVGGELRYVTDAKFRVYRSRNGGQDWEPLTNGLPQKNAYLHSMREGMATDSFDPCGIYIGTTAGQVFYSRNDGDSWELLIDNLPPINSVECATIE